MKKVIVTGARGFIGSHCIPFLEKKNFQIIPISSQSCNLFNKTEVRSLIAEVQPTHLLHLAWVTDPCEFWHSPKNENWLEASKDLLDVFCLAGGKRVVVAGTCAEYDWKDGLCSEFTTPLEPSTVYGKAKNKLRQYLEKLPVSWGWGRIFQPYGPREHPKKVVAGVIQSLILQKDFLCSLGTQIRDFLYVSDIADALVSFLDTDLQGAMNIASGLPMSIKEICLKVGDKLQASERILFGARPMSPGEAPKVVADVKRLDKELRWSPSYDLNRGLNETIQWWKKYAANY